MQLHMPWLYFCMYIMMMTVEFNVFYNSTVVNDTKCTVPLHGKKRHSQENVFWFVYAEATFPVF